MWLSKWLDHSLYTSWQNKQWIKKNTWYLKSPIDSYQIERHLSCRFNCICSLLPSFCTGWLTLHLTENIRSMTRSRGKAIANAPCLAILNGVHPSEHHVVPNMYAIFISLFFLISFLFKWRPGTTRTSGTWLDALASTCPDGGCSLICSLLSLRHGWTILIRPIQTGSLQKFSRECAAAATQNACTLPVENNLRVCWGFKCSEIIWPIKTNRLALRSH